jgi:hypothetical protein
MLLSFQSIAQQDSTPTIIVIKGIYVGKNIYFQNPVDNEVKGTFCTDSIFVNGKRAEANVNASAFEIDLTKFAFNIGAPVKILMYHKKFCKPKIMHSQPAGVYVEPWSKLTILTFDINTQGCAHITTTNTPIGTRSNIRIRQLRGDMWIPVASIPQNPDLKNSYDAQVTFYGGLNTFKLSPTYSPVSVTCVTYFSSMAPVTYTLDSAKTDIKFSDSVYYSIQNAEKVQLFRGYDKIIDISYLDSGSYTVFYENEKFLFDIKRTK